MSVNSSNFNSVFFKAACHANRELKEILLVQIYKFLNVFFKRFQKHQPKVRYHF